MDIFTLQTFNSDHCQVGNPVYIEKRKWKFLVDVDSTHDNNNITEDLISISILTQKKY